MNDSVLSEDISDALSRLASTVPVGVIDAVRTADYRPRTVNLRSYAPFGAAAAVAAIGGVVVATTLVSPRPPASSHPTRAAVVAYVGTTPRLAVTTLPEGFQLGPDIPVPTLPGESSNFGELPSKTFVNDSGTSDEEIVVAEGQNGEGPVPKLLAFAAQHPDVTTQEMVGQVSATVVDLAAAGAGDGYELYLPVDASTWALIGGSSGVTVDQLVAVAEGIVGGS